MVSIRIAANWTGGAGRVDVQGPNNRCAPAWSWRMDMTERALELWEKTWVVGDREGTLICSE